MDHYCDGAILLSSLSLWILCAGFPVVVEIPYWTSLLLHPLIVYFMFLVFVLASVEWFKYEEFLDRVQGRFSFIKVTVVGNARLTCSCLLNLKVFSTVWSVEICYARLGTLLLVFFKGLGGIPTLDICDEYSVKAISF